MFPTQINTYASRDGRIVGLSDSGIRLSTRDHKVRTFPDWYGDLSTTENVAPTSARPSCSVLLTQGRAVMAVLAV
jgi:hypothetical protein